MYWQSIAVINPAHFSNSLLCLVEICCSSIQLGFFWAKQYSKNTIFLFINQKSEFQSRIGVSNLLIFRNYKNASGFYLKRFCFLIKDKICKVIHLTTHYLT